MKHIKKFNESGEGAMLKMMANFTIELLLPILDMVPQEAERLGVSIADYFKHEGLDSRIPNLKELYDRAEGIPEMEEMRSQVEELFDKVEKLKEMD